MPYSAGSAGRGWKRRLATVAGALALAAGSLVAGGPAAASGGPEASFTVRCYPDYPASSCNLDGRSSTGDIVSWTWIHGTCSDDATRTGADIWIIRVAGCGSSFDVTLTVTDSSDRTDTLTRTVSIWTWEPPA